ncbi:MAG: PocR ligand-binding domain-containing protein [Bacteroidota bacterium]|nr:PocR ligand-binding domain-containing protein [Bacteroidota bacterium]MDP4190223.1 PocR ligand-binding domain-containing protein [Bacteroidota bacterium]MDP4195528.1 PocR ligand-binding domain-containing protein [Bacteroidota bacterium]
MNVDFFYAGGVPDRKKNSLVVEDSGIVGMQIKRSLLNMGYTVIDVVSSGEKAIELAEYSKLDFVLLDIKLSGIMDGIDTAKILKQKYDLPVIFITAYSDEETLNRAKIAEPSGYILKPFETGDLQTVIEIALYKHTIDKKLKQSEELYRTLVQTTHDGIVILDHGKIEFANEAFAKMVGYETKEITGMALSKIMDRQFSSALENHLKRLEMNDPVQKEYEISLLNKDGINLISASLHLNTTKYQNRDVVVCTVKDITESKRTREILKRTEEGLRAKLDYILSPEYKDQSVNLFELIDGGKIQEIQDCFAESFDVSSLITDTSGKPISQPSNFSNLCKIFRSNENGNLNCIESDRLFGHKAKENKEPYIHPCHHCGLTFAALPLIVANQHIATWFVGQVCTSEIDKNSVINYASSIGADTVIVNEELAHVKKMKAEKFEKIVKLLSLFVFKLSYLAYNNLLIKKDLFQRRKTEYELQKSEVKNEAILSAIPDFMIQVSEDGKYKCLKITNINDDYFWNAGSQKTYCIDDDFPEEIAALIMKNVKMTIATSRPQRFEFIFNLPDQPHYYETNVALLGTEDTLIMIRDITEKKNSETEIIKAKEKAESSDRLKSEFLAQMSHEIRTPINAILSFSSLLKEELEDKLSDGLGESFKIIDRAGRRLIRTIDEILEMSQLQTGNFDLNIVSVDLKKEVLESLLAEYLYAAKERQLDIRFESMIDHKVLVNADKHMLIQIFSNILDNAVKYTPEGKIEIVLFYNQQDEVCVRIQDTGIGISEEYLSRLFTPFSQEDSGYTRRYEGNGLGLALVKRYTELNNARVYVESQKGMGTAFTIVFGK